MVKVYPRPKSILERLLGSEGIEGMGEFGGVGVLLRGFVAGLSDNVEVGGLGREVVRVLEGWVRTEVESVVKAGEVEMDNFVVL